MHYCKENCKERKKDATLGYGPKSDFLQTGVWGLQWPKRRTGNMYQRIHITEIQPCLYLKLWKFYWEFYLSSKVYKYDAWLDQ